ncbi:MAG TPA: methyltransferase domain-containing protein, partial [Nitrospirae bacterium]|nr:methyltransferase domain-containing protein [Nitrospirota bacterium]
MRICSKLPEWALESICCPACRSDLELNNGLKCLNPECKAVFPVINNVPVLLDEKKSVFLKDDFINMCDTYHKRNSFVRTVFKLMPKISANIKAKRNYSKLTGLLLNDSKNPRVLVLGGGIPGNGIEMLFDPKIELLETDVFFGPRTAAIVDAHCIPFKDNTFDGVVIQAVLEHVVDPALCVKEIHRVLKDNGFVYSETAFMQQVHGGSFDFTRFTHLGHRLLFRQFQKIESGAVCGTG